MTPIAFSIAAEAPKKSSFLNSSLPIRRFSVAEYHKMGELGIFSEDERVELIDGVIIQMSLIGSKHAGSVNKLNWLFSSRLSPSEARIAVQNPVILDDVTEPQPDISVLKPKDDAYASAHPSPDDVLLIVEAADTTLEDDRAVKLPRYAVAGIPEVWIVNIPERKIEVYRIPIGKKEDAEYKIRVKYREGETLNPEAFPNVKIDVADMLP